MRHAVIILAMLASSSGAAAAQETPHLAFVTEYVRELATNEGDRVKGEQDFAEVGPNQQNQQLTSGIRASTRIILDLSSEAAMMRTMQMAAPFDTLAGNIAGFYDQKIALYRRLIEITTKILSGPQPGVDYGSLTAEIPQITAQLEFVDKSLFQSTPLIFATLVDSKHPDKEGHVSHLIITRAERDKLVHDLEVGFGKKLDADNQDYIVSSASVLRFYLAKKGYLCSDES